MAYAEHSKRVKHLNRTSGCPHYAGLAAPADAATKCATNGCGGRATRACHVVMVNQSGAKPRDGGGIRYIVYCCPECNGQKLGQANDVRSNAVMHRLDACDCGGLP